MSSGFQGRSLVMHNLPDALDRFLEAQASSYDRAMREIESGRKQSHWMWYVFPQLIGLGRSETSVRYAIRDLREARDYLAHPVLGPRLVAASQAVLGSKSTPRELFGTVDSLKFSSCMTLFAWVTDDASVFAKALGQGVKADQATLAMLGSGEFG